MRKHNYLQNFFRARLMIEEPESIQKRAETLLFTMNLRVKISVFIWNTTFCSRNEVYINYNAENSTELLYSVGVI